MNKIIFVIAALLLINTQIQSQNNQAANWKNTLIPKPVSIVKGQGYYKFPQDIVIITPANEEVKKIAAGLSQRLLNTTNYKVNIKEGVVPLSSSVFISLVNDKSIPEEGYRLSVSKKGVSLMAAKPAGIFYGLQTLYQLLPKNIVSKQRIQIDGLQVPVLTIEDHPRFGWRGLMLDVSRHFFKVSEVKDYIDQMAKYKFNLLHLHLTDDQGWRLQIKSLPKLTEVGAWRVDKTGTFGKFSAPTADEPKTYGGFYTHEDIKEIVQYAKDRFVNILPEIDIPGHSLAAIAAYPELTCTPGTYAVNSGEQFMIWPDNGQHFYGILDNTLCPANEKVFEFIDKVFTEVAQLFPFQYIHMGGDETARNFWEKSEVIKALMQKEKLKNLDEVQSYFVKVAYNLFTYLQ